MNAKEPFDPKRLMRPLRWVVMLVVLGYFVLSASRYSLLKLPAGVSPLFDVHAGDRAVVMMLNDHDAIEAGHIVLWRDGAGILHLGRVVAIAGERVAVDVERREVRRLDDAQPYPLPDGLVVPATLPEGSVLVLGENPLTRQEGGLVQRSAVEARVLGSMPF